MDYVSNSDVQVREMLKTIGISSIDALFAALPEKLKLPKPSNDDGLSELEGRQRIEQIARLNTFPNFSSYLGAGAYEHYVPALVQAICSKSEFLTAYTPYQAEASQGMLQAIFEFQSVVCALTGMDVSNASMYDGATACAEAILMATRLQGGTQAGRHKIAIAHNIHPHYRQVIEQFLSCHGLEITYIPFRGDGTLDSQKALQIIDKRTIAVLFSYPNFFGLVEDYSQIVSQAKGTGALTILSANPLVFGLYRSAGELEVDIAVGDTQPFGLPLQFGGPYVGYLACRHALLRQMPGRIVGETVDKEGRRGFVLTLQAREQHIRREKATSNICTNQALAALASLVAILWYGKEGIPKLALTNYQRTAYLKSHLDVRSMKIMNAHTPFFNEFVVDFGMPAHKVQSHFRSHGIEPGVPLGRFFRELENSFLVAVTELKSIAMLDHYVQVAKGLGTS